MVDVYVYCCLILDLVSYLWWNIEFIENINIVFILWRKGYINGWFFFISYNNFSFVSGLVDLVIIFVLNNLVGFKFIKNI